MTDAPFLDHREIRRLADQTPKLKALLAQREIFDAIDPITPAIVDDSAPRESKGYFATADGRIIFRLVTECEAQSTFGVSSVTTAEAFLVADRLSRLGEIEDAALRAQARAVKLMRAAEVMFEAISTGADISKKDRVRIGALLYEIRSEDAGRAQRIAEIKAENQQANRDRKWALRQLGVAS